MNAAPVLAVGSLVDYNGMRGVVIAFTDGHVWVKVGGMSYRAPYVSVWARGDGKAGAYNRDVAAAFGPKSRRAA